ncbi:MAG: DUF3667 domain-containing protein [Raineya sp.]|nr:DUF3667 domain-containing protein [Raineya sp.]MDW8297143.1 DUF3667 domain-containing protein [Raineya sp.]
MICKNCSNEFLDDFRFCPHCGHPAQLKRIDKNYFLDELAQLFNLEKGILFTIRALLTKPAEHIRIYLTENRSRYVKPIAFLIITSVLYALFNKFLEFEKKAIKFETNETDIPNFTEIVSENYEYFSILFSFLTALIVRLFFRKYPYNFFEVFVLQCYLHGVEMLISLFFGVLQSILKVEVELTSYGFLLGFIYTFVITAQFFDKTKIISYIKSLLASILSYIILLLIIAISVFTYYVFFR